MSSDIPGPPGLPILGNLRDIDPELPTMSLMQMADTYGMANHLPIFLSLPCSMLM